MRVLTDEHISPDIARDLARRGFDVTPVHDRGLLHKEDWELMAWCVARQSAIFTDNRRHFEREHRNCRARGEDRYGILIVGKWRTEEIYWALRQYLASDPDRTLINQVDYVPMADAEFIRQHSEGEFPI